MEIRELGGEIEAPLDLRKGEKTYPLMIPSLLSPGQHRPVGPWGSMVSPGGEREPKGGHPAGPCGLLPEGLARVLVHGDPWENVPGLSNGDQTEMGKGAGLTATMTQLSRDPNRHFCPSAEPSQ